MRAEPAILRLLVDWAMDDHNIRAIVLNGSRADPSRIPDALSDFDVAIVVHSFNPIKPGTWIDLFGDPIVRWPLEPQSTFSEDWLTQLVLFDEGLRIDFQFTERTETAFEQAGPYHCVLYDPERLTEHIPGSPVEGTVITLPTDAEFGDRINAFWWDISYVAKALRRNELDYARFIIEGDLRFNKLHPLIRWHIGAVHGTETDVGAAGRWFSRYVSADIWSGYLETFSGADEQDQWRAMFAMCSFVRLMGHDVARRLGFSYPDETDRRVRSYLSSIHAENA
jgi:aminoglycoside 6-adenylyltransferase